MNPKWYVDIEPFGRSCLHSLEIGFKNEVEPLYCKVKNELFPDKQNKDISIYENKLIIADMCNLLSQGKNDSAKSHCINSAREKINYHDNKYGFNS
ncbi:hypothetical protein ACFL52_04710 [Candidatus Margulisiibacteriota bacterium]